MQGGINNAGLFGASQREARSKLDQMAGIKRPNGILASSPELMRSVAGPTMGQPQPIMPMAQAPMIPPAMPMPTTVAPMAPAPAPRSLNPMAPAPAAGPGQQPVVKLNEGGEPLKGYSDMGARMAERAKASVAAGGSPVVDITRTATKFMEDLDKETGGAVTEKYGSLEAAEAEADKRMDNIQAAVETKDAAAIADAAVAAAGEEVTDAAKMDFAENVFGLEDVNDINEINRRIANVVVGSAVGKGPEEFAKAVVLGLNVLKQTAAARAEAKADAAGGGFLDTERGKAAVELYIERIKNNEDPVEVEAMMNEQLGNNIGTVVRVAIAGGTGGGAAPSAQSDQGLKKGQTATGPNGQKIQWDGTSWQKVQ